MPLNAPGIEIACIFSHEDDPGENCWFGSVREWGEERGIPVECPAEIRTAGMGRKGLRILQPEMIFSFYYRHMIPEEILRIPPKGAYNLHGSLLPAYRGRCPVNWVLVNGEDTDRGHPPSHGSRRPMRGISSGRGSCPSPRTIPHSPCTESSAMRRESCWMNSCP